MKQHRPYIIAYAVFLICLFTSPYVYAFFDFHLSDAYEHYDLERRAWEHQNPGEESFMSYAEWQKVDDQSYTDFYMECANQVAMAFDPWFEPQVHHNERGVE